MYAVCAFTGGACERKDEGEKMWAYRSGKLWKIVDKVDDVQMEIYESLGAVWSMLLYVYDLLYSIIFV